MSWNSFERKMQTGSSGAWPFSHGGRAMTAKLHLIEGDEDASWYGSILLDQTEGFLRRFVAYPSDDAVCGAHPMDIPRTSDGLRGIIRHGLHS